MKGSQEGSKRVYWGSQKERPPGGKIVDEGSPGFKTAPASTAVAVKGSKLLSDLVSDGKKNTGQRRVLYIEQEWTIKMGRSKDAIEERSKLAAKGKKRVGNHPDGDQSRTVTETQTGCVG